ncbi:MULTISPECIES: YodC family protein [Aphanothece]|uniref:YodC family protein n=1 Tax=Aphanothece TaxID=1121 RepID=UPI0039854ED0
MSDIDRELKPGDVVELRSGGPKMTIVGEGTYGGFVCQWFIGNKIQQAEFMLVALKRAEE